MDTASARGRGVAAAACAAWGRDDTAASAAMLASSQIPNPFAATERPLVRGRSSFTTPAAAKILYSSVARAVSTPAALRGLATSASVSHAFLTRWRRSFLEAVGFRALQAAAVVPAAGAGAAELPAGAGGGGHRFIAQCTALNLNNTKRHNKTTQQNDTKRNVKHDSLFLSNV